MSYLIDTNVVSELRKGPRCDPHVAAWFSAVSDEDVFLSLLTVGEIRRGVENIRRRDTAAAQALDNWLAGLAEEHGERLLSVDQAIADAWAAGSDLGRGRFAGRHRVGSPIDLGYPKRARCQSNRRALPRPF